MHRIASSEATKRPLDSYRMLYKYGDVDSANKKPDGTKGKLRGRSLRIGRDVIDDWVSRELYMRQREE